MRIAVSRESLLQRPAGWLTSWPEDLEKQGCIARGEGTRLADAVAGSLPLDPNALFRLLYATDRQSGQVDLAPGTRLQVVSPIMAEGKSFTPPVPVETTGAGNTLVVTLSVPDMLGYETALFEIRADKGRPGFSIVPLSAERHTNGETERAAQPAVNYFRFSEDAAFYRLFYKAGQTDFTALVAAAGTRGGLPASLLSCDELPAGMCVAIPKHAAVNPLIEITVNGSKAAVNWGATVGTAIRSAGERQPDSVLPHLSLSKLHNGTLATVNFDRSSHAVLDLVLTGGESISWK
jgi:hypothetical protein